MVFAAIASGEIDKPNLRTPHIVLHTVPSLSFSTPTHTVNFQLSLLTPPQDKFHRMTTVADAQSAVSYGSDRASLSSSIARAQSRQSSVAVDERSEELSQRQQEETASTNTFGKIEEQIEQRVDRLERRMDERFEGQNQLIVKVKADINSSIKKQFTAQDERMNKRFKDQDERMNKRFQAQDERMDRMEANIDYMQANIDYMQANIKAIMKSLETLTTYVMDPDRGTSLPIESAPRQTALTRMPAAASQASLVTRTSGKRSLKNTKFYRNLSGLFSGLRAQVNTNIDQLEISAAREAEDLEIRVEEPVAGPSPYLVAAAQSLGVSTEQLAASPSSQVSEAQRALINQPILPDWR